MENRTVPFFLIRNLSAFLSPVDFEAIDEAGQLLFRIKERGSAPGRALIRLTKFRTLFSLELEFLDAHSELKFVLWRDRGWTSSHYRLLTPDGGLKFAFEERRKGLLFLRREILDAHGELFAYCPPSRFGPKGKRSGVVKDLQDREIASFEWKGFSLFKGYRECLVFLREKDENWVLCSLVNAVIKGLYLHHR